MEKGRHATRGSHEQTSPTEAERIGWDVGHRGQETWKGPGKDLDLLQRCLEDGGDSHFLF